MAALTDKEKKQIVIVRVTQKVKKDFMKWAKEKFDGDEGTALMWLMDFKEGLLSSPNVELAGRIDIIAGELNLLKSQTQRRGSSEKEIRTVNGGIIKRRLNKNEQTKPVTGQG